MTLPLATIAIPTFNRLGYLKEAVASALAQTYPQVEVIIGNDGESMELRGWCEELAARDPRVRYQRNARRLGLAGNWNALIDAARGEFITIIGDDDRLLPGFISSLVEAARPPADGRGIDVAFSNHYLIDASGARLESESRACTRQYGRDLLPEGEVKDAARAVWRNSVPMSAALVRTSEVRRLRFKEDLNTPELELFARMAADGARFVFVPEYLAEYRVHAQSATTAGLRSERLAAHLLRIQVGPETEEYKRRLMAPLLVNAVSRCLQQGEREAARAFLNSEYYPRPLLRRRPVGASAHAEAEARTSASRGDSMDTTTRAWKRAVSFMVQGACAALPARIGCPIYRAVQKVKTSTHL